MFNIIRALRVALAEIYDDRLRKCRVATSVLDLRR